MNRFELPSLFDAVLDGSMPLDVFSDAVQDAGFVETGFAIQRLFVMLCEDWEPYVVCMKAVDNDDKLTGQPMAAVRNDDPTNIQADTMVDAGRKMRQLAVHYAQWAMDHGEAPRKPVDHGRIKGMWASETTVKHG